MFFYMDIQPFMCCLGFHYTYTLICILYSVDKKNNYCGFPCFECEKFSFTHVFGINCCYAEHAERFKNAFAFTVAG